jgi:transcriptional regulator with XRE-family HTH domain
VSTRSQLGEFLRTRRDRLQPGEAGLSATGSGRRVPGLRREELAGLAEVSPDYLRRLEQGRVLPSNTVLDALANALRLGPSEREHLQTLADRARGRPPRPLPEVGIRPTLLRMLEALSPTPAVVLGRCCEVLAWNKTGAALDKVVAHQPPEERNVARRIILDDSSRQLYPEWEALGQEVADVLQLNATRFSDDQALAALIDELQRESADFRRFWERHDVFEKTSGRKLVDHPDVGLLALEYESFEIAPLSGQVLIVYTAEPGSETADALVRLEDVAEDLELGLLAERHHEPASAGMSSTSSRSEPQ